MNNLEQANAGFMSYIEVSVERRHEPQTSTYESFLQLRREYEEKQKELERRTALEEMERKRLQALEAEKGEKKEKEGEGEKAKEQKKKEFFARSKQKGARIRNESQKGYDTMKEEKAKKAEVAALTSDSENEVSSGGECEG